jgi:hypothetical protein
MNMWRVGEDMGSKETDGCPLTISCVTFLSLIIFKIIPHPMTLLIAFPLQVTVSYFILHHLL